MQTIFSTKTQVSEICDQLREAFVERKICQKCPLSFPKHIKHIMFMSFSISTFFRLTPFLVEGDFCVFLPSSTFFYIPQESQWSNARQKFLSYFPI